MVLSQLLDSRCLSPAFAKSPHLSAFIPLCSQWRMWPRRPLWCILFPAASSSPDCLTWVSFGTSARPGILPWSTSSCSFLECLGASWVVPGEERSAIIGALGVEDEYHYSGFQSPASSSPLKLELLRLGWYYSRTFSALYVKVMMRQTRLRLRLRYQ